MSHSRHRRHQRARRTAAIRRHRHQVYAQGQAHEARGRRREVLVREALELLMQWGCILGYQMTEPGDDDDRQGIDAKIFTNDPASISFQIKGSYSGVQKHLAKHPRIPCVNVRGYTYAPDVAVMIQQQFDLPERPPDNDNVQP